MSPQQNYTSSFLKKKNHALRTYLPTYLHTYLIVVTEVTVVTVGTVVTVVSSDKNHHYVLPIFLPNYLSDSSDCSDSSDSSDSRDSSDRSG